MKNILAILLLGSLLTGCATTRFNFERPDEIEKVIQKRAKDYNSD